MQLFETRTTAPVIVENKKENFVLRRKSVNDDEPDTFIIEQEVMGVTPKQFIQTFKTLSTKQKEWNELIKSCTTFKVEDGIDINCSVIKSPSMFISERFIMNAVYIYEFPEKDEYIVIMSS